ncbi:MAG: STAS domain-containing protein [Thermoanaerobaculia bacterium]|nr:STAS domain-containing protein [Thermoanaerobaculia bacterium]
MFELEIVIRLRGRFDAAQAERVQPRLEAVHTSAVVDFAELTYISSAALGLLFAAQKRLQEAGHELVLVNLSPHVREVFAIAGFDSIFRIE